MSNTNLIYSCVFFNEKYIELIELLLKSYKLFGNETTNIDYLIICNPNFKNKIQKIFDELKINGKIWCLDLTTKFEAGYSRLNIFDYPKINLYNKILYLDCDILVTNSINNMFNIEIEDKIYAIQEDCHRYFHCEMFNDEEYELLDKESAFSSGILLFKNNPIIKELFSKILLHINNHINNNYRIPDCLDQPFIVYHAIKNNLYNNKRLFGIVINNPNKFNNETISHFPGGPGHYESKIVKMTNYMNQIMFNLNKKESFKKIEIDEYKKIINKNNTYFDKLYTICKEIGEKVEGNCFTAHMDIDRTINSLIYKQLNHFSLGSNATNIMEIGFNAGHSSLLYLLSNPNSKLTIFDLCEHKYTMPCFKYLQSVFPNRLEIIPGDSTKTIPHYYKSNPHTKFDLIHIDGGHFGDIPNKDFYNSLNLASDVIIWDDTQIESLDKLFNNYINKGLIYEIFLYKTFVYQHRICRVNNLLNKKYKWENSNIKFLENGHIDAIIPGKYSFIDKYLIKCTFNNKEYLLKFNKDYTEYISISNNDFEVIKGSNNLSFINKNILLLLFVILIFIILIFLIKKYFYNNIFFKRFLNIKKFNFNSFRKLN